MNSLNPTIAQALAPFAPGLTPVGHLLAAPAYTPTPREIIAVVAYLQSAVTKASQCTDTECCSFGQTKASGCACSMTTQALAIASIREASNKAARAYQAHDRRALQIQQNDVTATLGGWAS